MILNSNLIYKKNMKLYQNILILGNIYLCVLILIPLWHIILPKKYFYDSHTIKFFMSSASYLIPFDGYNTIALFYKSLGFENINNSHIQGVLVFSLAFFFLIKNINLFQLNNKKFLFIFSIWLIITSIYLGQLSKELLSIIIFSFLITISKIKNIIFIPLLILILGVSAYYFRLYYIIILGIVLLLYISSNFKNKKIKFFIIMGGIFFAFLLATSKGIYLTDARTFVNIGRINSPDAQTIINNPLQNTSVFTDFFNALYVFLFLIFPIPIILKLHIKYLVFAIWELMNIYIFIKILRFFNKKWLLPIQEKRKIKFSIYLIIAFTLTQAIFEPDYGSFLKHQIDIIPAFLYLFSKYYEYRGGNLNENNSCC